MVKKEKKEKKEPKASFDNVDALMDSINKKHGSNTIMSNNSLEDVEFQTTNILGLDYILGGGRPKGRIIEIFGPESSGKTGLALHMIGICQRLGGTCAFIDVEQALDPNYAKSHKVDMDKLLVSQPESAEQALEVTEDLAASQKVDLIVLDSVAALVPKAEIEGEMGASHMGLQARLMSQALRKLTPIVNKSNCTLIFINQLRMKIGVLWGSPETTTGGNALKFYCSVRIDVRRKEFIGGKENPTGISQAIKCVKNKVAPPFRNIELNMDFYSGYDSAADIAEHAINFGVIDKSGNTYSFEDEKLGVGFDNVVKYLKTNKETRKKIRKLAKECLNKKPVVVEE